MGLREQKKLQTRHAILETANRLFREKGYENTRVIDIIGPVQISKKTFFNYFPSKEAVLLALAYEWFAQRTTYEEPEPAGSAAAKVTSPIEKLKNNLLSRLDAIISDKEFVRTLVTHTDFLNPRPELGVLALSSLSDNYQEILRLIEQAQQCNEIRKDIPAQELNEIFIASRNAAISRWLANDDKFDLKQQMENVLKVVLKGFQAD